MTDCDYCHKPVLDGHSDITLGGNHGICLLEWDRRKNAGMCVICDKNKQHNRFTCGYCYKNRLDYQGYDGSQ